MSDKKLLIKLFDDTNHDWIWYADEFQSECAFIYLWEANLDWEDPQVDKYFSEGVENMPVYQKALKNYEETSQLLKSELTAENDPRIYWKENKWAWVKLYTAAQKIGADWIYLILEAPIRLKFLDFAENWVDTTDLTSDEYEAFRKKHYPPFKDAWIDAIKKSAPSDNDIFGDIWDNDETFEVINDVIEEEEELEDPEPIKDTSIDMNFGGSTAWVNEDTGEIKLSKNHPGGDQWVWIDSVNTGDVDADGKTLFVPSVLEGAIDWWVGLGNPRSDIMQVSKTKIIISGAGDYSKSWLRRYFFVKDKSGDLIISY